MMGHFSGYYERGRDFFYILELSSEQRRAFRGKRKISPPQNSPRNAQYLVYSKQQQQKIDSKHFKNHWYIHS
jgi:hypothetical protein